MAITETSLYAHCSSNFSFSVPAGEVWVTQEPACPQCHMVHDHTTVNHCNSVVATLSEQPVSPPVDRISPATTKRINARKILDYIRKIIHQQTLCKKHEQVLDQAIAELQLIYQQIPSSGDSHAKDELGDQTDHALLYSFLQLKKVTHCSNCRTTLRAAQDHERAAFDTPGTRVNQTGLIWALLRNWCDIFRSRSSNARTKPVIEETVNLESQRLRPAADCPSEPIDKSAYCWQWLLKQTGPPLSTAAVRRSAQSAHPLRQINHTELILTRVDADSSGSVVTVPSRATGTHLWSPLHSARTRSRSLSDLSSKDPWFHDHEAPKRYLPAPHQQPVHNRRKCSPLSSPHHLHIDATTSSSQSPRPKAARCVQLPHHVTRRPGLRVHYQSPVHQSSTQPRGPFRTTDHSHTFRPCFAAEKAISVDSNKPHRLSSYSYHLSHRQRQQQQQQLPQRQTQQHPNLRTINFLQSLSPNMNVVPPPNHNPFVVKPEV